MKRKTSKHPDTLNESTLNTTDEQHKQACFARWKASTEHRRKLAQAYLDKLIFQEDFDQHWQWLDVLAEADDMLRRRRKAAKAAAAAKAAYEKKHQQLGMF